MDDKKFKKFSALVEELDRKVSTLSTAIEILHNEKEDFKLIESLDNVVIKYRKNFMFELKELFSPTLSQTIFNELIYSVFECDLEIGSDIESYNKINTLIANTKIIYSILKEQQRLNNE